MSAIHARLAPATRDRLVALAFVAIVVVLWLTAYWLVPFQWTPPRVVA